MTLRPYVLWLALMSAASGCAAAGWPALDTHNGASLLQADQAFQMLPVERKGRTVKLEWSIAPGYFLYRDRIHVDALTPTGAQPAALTLPAAQRYDEQGEGVVTIYRNDLSATLQSSTARRFRVRFQGCSDSGVCYPPQTRTIDLKDTE